MRNQLTRERLHGLMQEIAKGAPKRRGVFRVFLVGGGTAVWAGWREASIDADLFTEHEVLFRDVQGMKERLNLNVEFTRPEHFVPPLPGAEDRHIFLEAIGPVRFYHYDPYSQFFSKVVRGFNRDLDDARHLLSSGMVDSRRFRELVDRVPDSAFARYPRLSPGAVRKAVEGFLESETREPPPRLHPVGTRR